ncbi:phage tail protein [Pseudomonas alloputida]|nr:DUF1983 domain-containing protein [Pseudomonas alloputida]MCE0923342.1 phage tail protein [Pseudomonas alloputida]
MPVDLPPIAGRKGGSEKTHTPVEAPDSVRSVARAKMLFALGEGEFAGNLDGRRIFLDGTPLIGADGSENFPGVKWEFRPGTQHQEHIPGLPAVENETSVGVELRSDTPWVKDLTNPELSAARVRLSWPALQERKDNGDVVGYRIDYAIDLSVDGGLWKEVFAATLNDKTTTKYERSHRIDLPKSASGWSLRVRRITPNTQKTNNISDTMRVEAITEVIDAKLRYPNTALLYIEFDSSQFQSIPKVSCEPDMRVVRVPSNYDPVARTYSGLWDGTFKWAWTDNPAWVLYDIILHKRFGMGRRLDMSKVDRWELYEIARYCDELVSDGKGGQEPRFTCNVYIQKRADAWTVLRDIAAIFRGITYWSGSEMVVQADKPSDVEFVFSRSNVTDGKFSYDAQSERTRYSSALVSWDNPDNAYESQPQPVSIPALIRRYNFNQTEITAIGCTRQSEADRRGRWLLLTNSVDRGIKFGTGLEGYLPKPGRIIGVADALLAGRQLGGRISSATARQIKVDRDVQVKAGDRLIVNLPSGKAEARTVSAVSGRTVTVTADFSEVPKAQAQWGLESADLVIQQYRVTKVSRSDSGFEITGVMNDPGKYDQVDSGSRLEKQPISVIPARTQQAPTGVAVSSYTRTEQGLAVTTLRAEWQAAPAAIAYVAEWRKDSGAWIAAARTSGLGFEVPGIYAGRYTVRVRAVNALEVSSLPAYSPETVLNGKEGAPPTVATFTATPLPWGIGLAWTFPDGADDTRYTEIEQNAAATDENAALLGLYPYPQRSYELTGLAAGVSKHFRARLVDTSGNAGPWTDWVLGTSSSDPSDYLPLITEEIVHSALGEELLSRIDKIDMDGPGSVNERVGEVRNELNQQVGEVNNAIETVKSSVADARSELQQQLAAVDQEVDAARSELQQQINTVSALAGSLPYNKDKAYTLNQGTLGADGKLYQALKAVPKNNPPPNATYWTDVGQAIVTAAGTATRVGKVETDVSTLNGTSTAQATKIEGLQSGLTTTNGNVTAAQQAAQAAATAAGAKGEVIYGTTAPAADKRLTQNLWIDTTGNANTPKRWNGSTWVAVTDKVATDAAAAAANALAVAQTKADAQAVQSVTTRVTDVEGAVSAQGQAMTGLQSNLTTTKQDVTAAQQAAQAAATAAGAKGEVIYGTTAPAADKRLAQNLWIDTTGNANTPKRWNGSTWVAVTDKVATDAAAAAANALAVAQTKADAQAVQSVTTRVTDVEGAVSAQGQAMTGLQSSLTTTKQDVTAAQQAAQAAATAAGAKGEVIYGSTAPAADKRLTQNLWIDTTGNANTPKRWNGSTWVAVSDKVATDAAAAAAAASALAATKADASAVNLLTNRVSNAEGVLTSYSSDITQLKNSLSAAQSFVAGKAWEFTGSTRGWFGTISGSTFVAGPLFATAGNCPNLQCNFTPTFPGAENPFLRIRLRRRNTARAGAQMYWANEDGGLAEARRMPWTINTTTTDWQDIEIDLSGHAGWTGKNILAIRLDMMSASDTTGEIDIAYIAVGRRSIAASAEAVSNLSSAVSDADGKLTSQGQSIVSLQNGLTTTNQGVTAAQQAAQAAATAAGAKGEVIYGSTAPAADKRLAQNLWIDTAGNANTPKRWNGSTWVTVTDKVATDAAAAAQSALTEVAKKADASTVQNLSNTVAQHGQDITAQGQAMTAIDAAITEVGGENLLYNPTFNRASTADANVPDGWFLEGAATKNPSLVASWLNSGEQAFRVAVTGVTSSSPYLSLVTHASQRPKIAGGQTVTSSVYARRMAESGLLSLRLIHQWYNEAGAVISAPANGFVPITVEGGRITFTSVAPAGAVRVNVYFRIHGQTAAAANGSVELARPQAEYGSRATGWRDNGQVTAGEVAANVSATNLLSGRVSQTEQGLVSQGQSIVSLEGGLTTTKQNVTAAQQAAQAAATAAGAKGEVIYGSTAPAADKRLAQNLWIDTTGNANTPKRWNGSAWVAVTDKVATDAATAAASALSQVATKAEASAVNSLTNRVSSAEGTLSSNSSDITQLKNSIGTAQPFVAGKSWEFIGSTLGWVGTISGSTFTAGPLFATAGKCPNLQCNFTPAIAGAENPYLRIRLRRRNTTRAGAQMYWANEDGGLAEARRMAWAISLTTNDWQDIEFDLSGHSGWNGKSIIAIRLDMMNSVDTSGEIDIAYIAVGRRSAAASAQAVANLESNVTQQGGKLTAEGLRIDGLYTAVGDANAAIQNEAKARVDGDGAISKQLQTTQASLGTTNAAVQQVATAQADMKGMLNAQYTVRVQVNNQYKAHVFAGFGIGINEQNGVVQSAFVVNADQFVLLNSYGGGLSSPWSVVGGQTFVADAYIRNGSIGRAKIADAAIGTANIEDGAIKAAKIGVAEIDTLRIRGNAVTVPVSANSPGNVLGAGVGQWQNLIAVGVQMDEGGFITAQYSCYQGFGSGIRKYMFQMDINGLVIAQGGGDWADGFPNLMGSIGVAPGYFVITVKWWGENSGVGVQNHNLYAMGTKR